MSKPLIDNHCTGKDVVFNGVTIKSPIPGASPRAAAYYDDKVIVIFHYGTGNFKDLPTANAFAFDKNGKALWAVEEYGPYSDLFKNHYIEFFFDEKAGVLVMVTFGGTFATLDLESGKRSVVPMPEF